MAYKDVFTIIEPSPEAKAQGRKANWIRIGVAFTNKDGSFAVKLDAYPANGKLHICDPLPKQDRPQRAPQQPSFGGTDDFNPPSGDFL